MYARVTNGARMGMPEVIDEGGSLNGTQFTDGRQIVGIGNAIAEAAMGVVRVVYQDTTAGTLRAATRMMAGWNVVALDSTNSAGYWSRIAGGKAVAFYRDMANATGQQYGVRVFTLP